MLEAFGAKLKACRFCERKVLNSERSTVAIARPAHDVAPFVPELPCIRGRIELLKGAAADPLVGSMRARIRIRRPDLDGWNRIR